MEIREGWSTNYGKQKFDVTVQEADLLLIFSENGIPAECVDQLTMGEKFAVMKGYAHWYSVTEAIRLAPPEQHMEASTKASVEGQNLARVIEAFKARVGLAGPAIEQPYQERADDGAVQPVAIAG